MFTKSILFVSLILGSLAAADTAHAGSVTIINNGYNNGQQTCREFTSDITVGNVIQRGVGTACQQGDGSWLVTNGPGLGSAFFDNGIPVAYPASNYLASNDGYYNNIYYGQPVYYQEPVRVRYVFVGQPRYAPVIAPAPIVIYRGNRWDHGYGYPPRGRDWRRDADWRNDRRNRPLPGGIKVDYRRRYNDPYAPQYPYRR